MLRKITNYKNSDAYRSRIHDLIPGGAHTYSKGDDQFPALAPAAIDYGRGSHVWDVDGNEFLDCSMGLTSVSLGHAYEPVIRRAVAEMERGANFQRPSRLEMEFAERFLAVVKNHQMVKLAKNGSVVTTAAVKIARGYTGRKLVAFPGDHPFYSYDDWFIGKTVCNFGVPEEFQALSVTFKSYDIESLKALFAQYPGQIACVITEPEKNFPIPPDYLRDAIELAHKDGALFIVDEMITGFKTDMPGSAKKFGIDPDMTTWGKGIGNGFSICALTGKKEIMELGGIRRKGSEKLFLISTTHGAETHALAAGIAVLNEFEKKDVLGHNQSIGRKLIRDAAAAVSAAGLSDRIEVVDCAWQPLFLFKNAKGEVDNGFRTLMLQEMIARGVLFQGILSPCFSHTEVDVAYFVEALADSFSLYKKALAEGYEKFLIGEPTRPVFRKVI